MIYRKIKDDVYSIGAVDWDRRIFDELIKIPNGTSYNSYVVKGNKKTALIDTVDPAKCQMNYWKILKNWMLILII